MQKLEKNLIMEISNFDLNKFAFFFVDLNLVNMVSEEVEFCEIF